MSSRPDGLFSLAGRRALVTGGSGGIGLAIARLFAEAGADVVIAARGADRLRAAAAGLRDAGLDVATETLDMSRPETLGQAFADIVGRQGEVDILVNGVGVYVSVPALAMPVEDFASVCRTNLAGTFALSQAFAKALVARGAPGRIVNVASVASTMAINLPAAGYVASKGGLATLTKQLAAEWAEHGILVNAIAPGWTSTEMTTRLRDSAAFGQWLQAHVPLKRWGRPEEIAGAALLLASEAGAFMTGAMLSVDGGLSAVL